MIGAVLVTRSFAKLADVDLGFRTDHILTMTANLGRSACDMSQTQRLGHTPEENLKKCHAALWDILNRVQGLAGVQSAAASGGLPLLPAAFQMSLQFEGSQGESDVLRGNFFGVRSVSPGYFTTIGIPLLAGRAFSEHDTDGAPLVAIVNETFAHKYLPINPVAITLP